MTYQRNKFLKQKSILSFSLILYIFYNSKEKEEQARLKREMLIMQGKLEDSDSRIQNIKQIHDQQNKKIKQIDQEKVKLILCLI